MSKNKEADFLDEIIELAFRDNLNLDVYAGIIKDFYSNNYHHNYRNILVYVHDEKGNAEYAVELCEFLIESFLKEDNIKLLKGNVKNKYTNKYISNLIKLVDYLKLESYRSKILKEQEYAFNNNLRIFQKGLNEYSEILNNKINDLNELSDKIKSLDDKVDRQELSFVGTLGIFTGIVMAFAGTFTIIGNAITNLDKFNIFEISYTTVLLGFVLSNIIWILLYSISLLMRREDKFTKCYVNVQALSCNVCDLQNTCKRKFFKRNAVYLAINAISIVLMILLVLLN